MNALCKSYAFLVLKSSLPTKGACLAIVLEALDAEKVIANPKKEQSTGQEGSGIYSATGVVTSDRRSAIPMLPASSSGSLAVMGEGNADVLWLLWWRLSIQSGDALGKY